MGQSTKKLSHTKYPHKRNMLTIQDSKRAHQRSFVSLDTDLHNASPYNQSFRDDQIYKEIRAKVMDNINLPFYDRTYEVPSMSVKN